MKKQTPEEIRTNQVLRCLRFNWREWRFCKTIEQKNEYGGLVLKTDSFWIPDMVADTTTLLKEVPQNRIGTWKEAARKPCSKCGSPRPLVCNEISIIERGMFEEYTAVYVLCVVCPFITLVDRLHIFPSTYV